MHENKKGKQGSIEEKKEEGEAPVVAGGAATAAATGTSEADDGDTALKILEETPDIAAIVLDRMMPRMDGYQFLRAYRKERATPVIILTAREEETDAVLGLDLGADDYVEKPFGVGELLARLRVAMRHRRQGKNVASQIVAGDLSVDLEKRLVTRAGAPLKLSPKEYDLLVQLIEGGGKVVTHRQLLTAVWGPAHVEDVQYLRVFVAQLRQKIEADPSTPALITTEPGVGYRWLG